MEPIVGPIPIPVAVSAWRIAGQVSRRTPTPFAPICALAPPKLGESERLVPQRGSLKGSLKDR